MLEDLAQHLVDLSNMLLVVGVVDIGHLHDVIPGEVQICESSILLQNLKKWPHLVRHELVPADIQAVEGLLRSDDFTQVDHGEIIKTRFDQRQLPEVVSLAHTFDKFISSTPNTFCMNKMQL